MFEKNNCESIPFSEKKSWKNLLQILMRIKKKCWYFSYFHKYNRILYESSTAVFFNVFWWFEYNLYNDHLEVSLTTQKNQLNLNHKIKNRTAQITTKKCTQSLPRFYSEKYIYNRVYIISILEYLLFVFNLWWNKDSTSNTNYNVFLNVPAYKMRDAL